MSLIFSRFGLTDDGLVRANPSSPRRRRVVITRMGTVNALTSGGRSAVAEALALGRSGIGPLRRFVGAGHERARGRDRRRAAGRPRRSGRGPQALADLPPHRGGVPLCVEDGGRIGPGLAIVVGSEHGDFRSSEEFAGGYLQRGPAGLSPMIFPNTVMNTMASVAAIAVGARAPSVTLNQATIVGDLAVARAAAIVARGNAEAAVAGGVDEICALVYRHLQRLGALSPMRGRGPGLPALCGGSQWPGARRGRDVSRAREPRLPRARGRGSSPSSWTRRWGMCRRRPTRRGRVGGSRLAVGRLLAAHAGWLPPRVRAGNGDAGVDDWERGLLARDLGPRDAPPLSLAPLFGQHGGLGALRVAAAGAGRGARRIPCSSTDRARRLSDRADRRGPGPKS